MSGLDLAKKIWQSAPSLKIMIMSGYSTEILADNAASGLDYTFLAKPFDLKALPETVRQCLELGVTP